MPQVTGPLGGGPAQTIKAGPSPMKPIPTGASKKDAGQVGFMKKTTMQPGRTKPLAGPIPKGKGIGGYVAPKPPAPKPMTPNSRVGGTKSF